MERQIVLLENNVKEQQKELESLNQVVVVQQTARKDYEEACAVSDPLLLSYLQPCSCLTLQTAAEQAVSELKTMLSKRDAENARLREQRDQQLSELNERKQKEHVKLSSLNEFKSLAESREVSFFIAFTNGSLTFGIAGAHQCPGVGTLEAEDASSGGCRRRGLDDILLQQPFRRCIIRRESSGATCVSATSCESRTINLTICCLVLRKAVFPH